MRSLSCSDSKIQYSLQNFFLRLLVSKKESKQLLVIHFSHPAWNESLSGWIWHVRSHPHLKAHLTRVGAVNFLEDRAQGFHLTRSQVPGPATQSVRSVVAKGSKQLGSSTARSPLVAFLLLVAMPGAPTSFLLLVVRPGAPVASCSQ